MQRQQSLSRYNKTKGFDEESNAHNLVNPYRAYKNAVYLLDISSELPQLPTPLQFDQANVTFFVLGPRHRFHGSKTICSSQQLSSRPRFQEYARHFLYLNKTRPEKEDSHSVRSGRSAESCYVPASGSLWGCSSGTALREEELTTTSPGL